MAPALDLFGNPLGSGGGADAGAGAGAPPAGGAPDNAPDNALSQTYAHENPNFSFRHPDGFSTSSLSDENGETVLVRGWSDQESFQIYITPFDEPFDPAPGGPGPITPERIREDIPDMVIEQARELEIAGVKMLAFLSGESSAGRTREVWFAHGPHLYQITAYPEFDRGLAEILMTWVFR